MSDKEEKSKRAAKVPSKSKSSRGSRYQTQDEPMDLTCVTKKSESPSSSKPSMSSPSPHSLAILGTLPSTDKATEQWNMFQAMAMSGVQAQMAMAHEYMKWASSTALLDPTVRMQLMTRWQQHAYAASQASIFHHYRDIRDTSRDLLSPKGSQTRGKSSDKPAGSSTRVKDVPATKSTRTKVPAQPKISDLLVCRKKTADSTAEPSKTDVPTKSTLDEHVESLLRAALERPGRGKAKQKGKKSHTFGSPAEVSTSGTKSASATKSTSATCNSVASSKDSSTPVLPRDRGGSSSPRSSSSQQISPRSCLSPRSRDQSPSERDLAAKSDYENKRIWQPWGMEELARSASQRQESRELAVNSTKSSKQREKRNQKIPVSTVTSDAQLPQGKRDKTSKPRKGLDNVLQKLYSIHSQKSEKDGSKLNVESADNSLCSNVEPEPTCSGEQVAVPSHSSHKSCENADNECLSSPKTADIEVTVAKLRKGVNTDSDIMPNQSTDTDAEGTSNTGIITDENCESEMPTNTAAIQPSVQSTTEDIPSGNADERPEVCSSPSPHNDDASTPTQFQMPTVLSSPTAHVLSTNHDDESPAAETDETPSNSIKTEPPTVALSVAGQTRIAGEQSLEVIFTCSPDKKSDSGNICSKDDDASGVTNTVITTKVAFHLKTLQKKRLLGPRCKRKIDPGQPYSPNNPIFDMKAIRRKQLMVQMCRLPAPKLQTLNRLNMQEQTRLSKCIACHLLSNHRLMSSHRTRLVTSNQDMLKNQSDSDTNMEISEVLDIPQAPLVMLSDASFKWLHSDETTNKDNNSDSTIQDLPVVIKGSLNVQNKGDSKKPVSKAKKIPVKTDKGNDSENVQGGGKDADDSDTLISSGKSDPFELQLECSDEDQNLQLVFGDEQDTNKDEKELDTDLLTSDREEPRPDSPINTRQNAGRRKSNRNKPNNDGQAANLIPDEEKAKVVNKNTKGSRKIDKEKPPRKPDGDIDKPHIQTPGRECKSTSKDESNARPKQKVVEKIVTPKTNDDLKEDLHGPDVKCSAKKTRKALDEEITKASVTNNTIHEKEDIIVKESRENNIKTPKEEKGAKENKNKTEQNVPTEEISQTDGKAVNKETKVKGSDMSEIKINTSQEITHLTKNISSHVEETTSQPKKRSSRRCVDVKNQVISDTEEKIRPTRKTRQTKIKEPNEKLVEEICGLGASGGVESKEINSTNFDSQESSVDKELVIPNDMSTKPSIEKEEAAGDGSTTECSDDEVVDVPVTRVLRSRKTTVQTNSSIRNEVAEKSTETKEGDDQIKISTSSKKDEPLHQNVDENVNVNIETLSKEIKTEATKRPGKKGLENISKKKRCIDFYSDSSADEVKCLPVPAPVIPCKRSQPKTERIDSTFGMVSDDSVEVFDLGFDQDISEEAISAIIEKQERKPALITGQQPSIGSSSTDIGSDTDTREIAVVGNQKVKQQKKQKKKPLPNKEKSKSGNATDKKNENVKTKYIRPKRNARCVNMDQTDNDSDKKAPSKKTIAPEEIEAERSDEENSSDATIVTQSDDNVSSVGQVKENDEAATSLEISLDSQLTELKEVESSHVMSVSCGPEATTAACTSAKDTSSAGKCTEKQDDTVCHSETVGTADNVVNEKGKADVHNEDIDQTLVGQPTSDECKAFEVKTLDQVLPSTNKESTTLVNRVKEIAAPSGTCVNEADRGSDLALKTISEKEDSVVPLPDSQEKLPENAESGDKLGSCELDQMALNCEGTLSKLQTVLEGRSCDGINQKNTVPVTDSNNDSIPSTSASQAALSGNYYNSQTYCNNGQHGNFSQNNRFAGCASSMPGSNQWADANTYDCNNQWIQQQNNNANYESNYQNNIVNEGISYQWPTSWPASDQAYPEMDNQFVPNQSHVNQCQTLPPVSSQGTCNTTQTDVPHSGQRMTQWPQQNSIPINMNPPGSNFPSKAAKVSDSPHLRRQLASLPQSIDINLPDAADLLQNLNEKADYFVANSPKKIEDLPEMSPQITEHSIEKIENITWPTPKPKSKVRKKLVLKTKKSNDKSDNDSEPVSIKSTVTVKPGPLSIQKRKLQLHEQDQELCKRFKCKPLSITIKRISLDTSGCVISPGKGKGSRMTGYESEGSRCSLEGPTTPASLGRLPLVPYSHLSCSSRSSTDTVPTTPQPESHCPTNASPSVKQLGATPTPNAQLDNASQGSGNSALSSLLHFCDGDQLGKPADSPGSNFSSGNSSFPGSFDSGPLCERVQHTTPRPYQEVAAARQLDEKNWQHSQGSNSSGYHQINHPSQSSQSYTGSRGQKSQYYIPQGQGSMGQYHAQSQQGYTQYSTNHQRSPNGTGQYMTQGQMAAYGQHQYNYAAQQTGPRPYPQYMPTADYQSPTNTPAYSQLAQPESPGYFYQGEQRPQQSSASHMPHQTMRQASDTSSNPPSELSTDDSALSNRSTPSHSHHSEPVSTYNAASTAEQQARTLAAQKPIQEAPTKKQSISEAMPGLAGLLAEPSLTETSTQLNPLPHPLDNSQSNKGAAKPMPALREALSSPPLYSSSPSPQPLQSSGVSVSKPAQSDVQTVNAAKQKTFPLVSSLISGHQNPIDYMANRDDTTGATTTGVPPNPEHSEVDCDLNYSGQNSSKSPTTRQVNNYKNVSPSSEGLHAPVTYSGEMPYTATTSPQPLDTSGMMDRKQKARPKKAKLEPAVSFPHRSRGRPKKTLLHPDGTVVLRTSPTTAQISPPGYSPMSSSHQSMTPSSTASYQTGHMSNEMPPPSMPYKSPQYDMHRDASVGVMHGSQQRFGYTGHPDAMYHAHHVNPNTSRYQQPAMQQAAGHSMYHAGPTSTQSCYGASYQYKPPTQQPDVQLHPGNVGNSEQDEDMGSWLAASMGIDSNWTDNMY